jgi:hypothetical protein
MKQLTQTIIVKHFGSYQPGEFLPIWSGGELLNVDAFVAYKLKRAAKQLLPASLR